MLYFGNNYIDNYILYYFLFITQSKTLINFRISEMAQAQVFSARLSHEKKCKIVEINLVSKTFQFGFGFVESFVEH